MSEFIRSIDDIVGHKNIINYLKTRIYKNKIPKVIMFSGSPGLGKTSIAKVLAIIINDNKESLYESVIDNNKSTDCIKLYDMSSVGDETNEIIAELGNTSFSSTNKKVIILDEVHGMTKKAQDAILVTLEYLPDNIYVFMCTTEMTMLRESLLSRCIIFNLNNLSNSEIKTLILRKIEAMSLRFSMDKNMIINIIATWSNNQPRKALNLIESFEEGSVVSNDDLSAFVPLNNISIVLSILTYLYGSLTKGIEFIETLNITKDMLDSLIEVLKVALGHRSNLIGSEDTIFITKFFKANDINNFLYFTLNVTSYEYINKRNFTSKFIENHISIFKNSKVNLKVSSNIDDSIKSDIKTIEDNPIDVLRGSVNELPSYERNLIKEASIDELFDMGQTVE